MKLSITAKLVLGAFTFVASAHETNAAIGMPRESKAVGVSGKNAENATSGLTKFAAVRIQAATRSRATVTASRSDVSMKVIALRVRAAAKASIRAGVRVAPARADSLADAVGVNTHFNYADTPYATVPAIKANLIASGIRHIRDGAPLQSARYTATMNDLYANHGIDQIGGIDPATPDEQTIRWIQATPGVRAIEACNECDSRGGDWYIRLRASQARLYQLVHTHKDVFTNVKVLAPSLASIDANVNLIGNLSAVSDYGNIHAGLCGANPGDTQGTGAFFAAEKARYAVMNYYLNGTRIVTPAPKPIYVTEWAYSDGPPPSNCGIPDAYIAAYEPRAVLEWALRGVHRVYVYQFADQPNDAMFGREGLVSANGLPKPQYFALKNFISIFADAGKAFTPAPVTLSITAKALVHHYVTRKRNGTVLVSIWREAQDYIFRSFTPANLPNEAATVVVGGAYKRGFLHVFKTDGSVTKSSIHPDATLHLSLGATLQVIELRR